MLQAFALSQKTQNNDMSVLLHGAYALGRPARSAPVGSAGKQWLLADDQACCSLGVCGVRTCDACLLRALESDGLLGIWGSAWNVLDAEQLHADPVHAVEALRAAALDGNPHALSTLGAHLMRCTPGSAAHVHAVCWSCTCSLTASGAV